MFLQPFKLSTFLFVKERSLFLLEGLRNEKDCTHFGLGSIVISVFKQRRKNADG
ncbi:hypothetical protein HMPREF9953_1810 [Haemophilus parainfluenzae ATCC 33392]|nr:hypothetical protein HMPREF1118_1904 [Haemophilus parainfluenzae HK262]KFL98912.1 hypothetical protein HMPREF9953_1810 [Haemophilus parainfluenzae ATCC 33392]